MKYTVVGVKFKEGSKLYYFDPKDIVLDVNDKVVVETNRGDEFAYVASPISQVEEKDVVLPLKSIIRKATDKDIKQVEDNKKKAEEAIGIIEKTVEKHGLDMKIVEVEYVFDGSKVLINFISDNRVDFRELVKELAGKLRTRIELRQIGIRDQAKTTGGIGLCGRECCCKSFLNDFEKVSIKMAKNQGLSLNPTQISGLCGRLLCCLEYENPYYVEVLSKMPKMNSQVSTPEGKGTVVYLNILKQLVSVKIFTSDDVFSIKEFPLDKITFQKNKEE